MWPVSQSLRWLSRFWRRLLLAGLALSALAIAITLPRAERHFGKSGDSCASCHVESAREAHTGEHATLACSACHESHFTQNIRQYALSWVSSASTEHGRVDSSACKTCHTSGTVESWHLARTEGHVLHVTGRADPLECSACHELSGHRVVPKPERCAECHAGTDLFDHTPEQMPGGQAVACLSCHEFLAPTDVGGKMLATDCRRCHGAPAGGPRESRFATTVPGEVITRSQIHGSLKACSLCHDPHAEDPEQRRDNQDCTRCHDEVNEEHHQTKQPGRFDCSSCHQVHGDRNLLTASCRGCHDEPLAKGPTLAASHGRCTDCHQAHDFVAQEDGCKGCHQDPVSVLAGWNAEKHADCGTCHEPHSGRPETALCASCHQKTSAHGHQSCTTCHEPHQNAANVKACGTCHTQELVATSGTASSHRGGCATCHASHQTGTEQAACRNCHRDETQLVQTARTPQHKACDSCHAPHTFSSDPNACKTCHALPDPGLHSGNCSDCHQPHGPALGRASRCSNCHAEVTSVPGAHRECKSCHSSAHAAVTAEPPACTGCHAREGTLVTSWTAPPHRECQSCHQPHAATKPAACSSCHEKEARATAKVAKHRCASCHSTHEAPGNLWGECNDCHASTVQAAAQRGPTHAACRSCHEPHSTTAPSCNSCHQSLPAAHASKGHDRCNDCHSTHARTPTTRAQCLKCHTDQTNHFPDASSCAGCHLFK